MLLTHPSSPSILPPILTPSYQSLLLYFQSLQSLQRLCCCSCFTGGSDKKHPWCIIMTHCFPSFYLHSPSNKRSLWTHEITRYIRVSRHDVASELRYRLIFMWDFILKAMILLFVCFLLCFRTSNEVLKARFLYPYLSLCGQDLYKTLTKEWMLHNIFNIEYREEAKKVFWHNQWMQTFFMTSMSFPPIKETRGGISLSSFYLSCLPPSIVCLP